MKEKVSAAFKQVSDKAAGIGALVGKLASDMKTVVKSNAVIFVNQSKIKKAETELGHIYFADQNSGNTQNEAAYDDLCEKIAEASRKISENEKLLEAARTVRAGKTNEPDEITDEDFEKYPTQNTAVKE